MADNHGIDVLLVCRLHEVKGHAVALMFVDVNYVVRISWVMLKLILLLLVGEATSWGSLIGSGRWRSRFLTDGMQACVRRVCARFLQMVGFVFSSSQLCLAIFSSFAGRRSLRSFSSSTFEHMGDASALPFVSPIGRLFAPVRQFVDRCLFCAVADWCRCCSTLCVADVAFTLDEWLCHLFLSSLVAYQRHTTSRLPMPCK